MTCMRGRTHRCAPTRDTDDSSYLLLELMSPQKCHNETENASMPLFLFMHLRTVQSKKMPIFTFQSHNPHKSLKISALWIMI